MSDNNNNNNNDDDLFQGVGIEVDILDSENFLKIKETLTRIGVASRQTNTLYQSCHILHKRDNAGNSHYAIVHFKEMFKLDGKPSSLEQKDVDRRNRAVVLLQDWNLLKIMSEEDINNNLAPMSAIKVLSHREKNDWTLVEKYKIGKK